MQREKVGQNKVHTAPLIQRIEVDNVRSGENFNSNPPVQQNNPFESSFIFFKNLNSFNKNRKAKAKATSHPLRFRGRVRGRRARTEIQGG